MDRRANALDLALARRNPGFDRGGADRAVAGHGGGKPALGIADCIPRPIERQPIEIIDDGDSAGGAGNAVERKNAPAAKLRVAALSTGLPVRSATSTMSECGGERANWRCDRRIVGYARSREVLAVAWFAR